MKNIVHDHLHSKLNLMRNYTTLCDSFLQKQTDLKRFKPSTTSNTKTTLLRDSGNTFTIEVSAALVTYMLDSTNKSGPSETYESTHTGSDDALAPKCQQNQYRIMNYFKNINKNLKNKIQYLKKQLYNIK